MGVAGTPSLVPSALSSAASHIYVLTTPYLPLLCVPTIHPLYVHILLPSTFSPRRTYHSFVYLLYTHSTSIYYYQQPRHRPSSPRRHLLTQPWLRTNRRQRTQLAGRWRHGTPLRTRRRRYHSSGRPMALRCHVPLPARPSPTTHSQPFSYHAPAWCVHSSSRRRPSHHGA